MVVDKSIFVGYAPGGNKIVFSGRIFSIIFNRDFKKIEIGR